MVGKPVGTLVGNPEGEGVLLGAGDGWLLGGADGAKEGAGVGLLEVGALVGVRVGTDGGNKLEDPTGPGRDRCGQRRGPERRHRRRILEDSEFLAEVVHRVTISSFESPLHTILMVYESPQCVSLLSVLIVVRVVGRG